MRAGLLPRGSAERRASDLAYAQLHRLEKPVLAAVRRRLLGENVALPYPDLEAAYNQAWQCVFQTITQGQEIENLMSLLITITYRRAVDINRRRRHEATVSPVMLDSPSHDADLVDRVDDQLRLNRLIERMSERLNPRERTAVALCTLHGCSRRDAAQRLGVREARLHKIMDSASKKITGIVAEIDIHGCGDNEWAGALRAFALGTITQDSPDNARVASHIEDCAPCRRYVMVLRGLAAVLPPPILLFSPGQLSQLGRLLAQTARGGRTARTGLSTQTSTRIASRAGSLIYSPYSSPATGWFAGGLAKMVAISATAALTAIGGGFAITGALLHSPNTTLHTSAPAPPPPVGVPETSRAFDTLLPRKTGPRELSRRRARQHRRDAPWSITRPRQAPAAKPTAFQPPTVTSSARVTSTLSAPQSSSRGSQSGEFSFEKSKKR